ncbi:MAG TPA: hypothetical protein VFU47_10475, partial [Armatimonadota bacterium]|nr:hypothetical protein [Armatimonadota bacterium]
LLWRTVVVCLRFSPWVLPVVLLLDLVVMPLVFAAAQFPVGYMAWKLYFFWVTSRWDPVRGAFRAPRWPRAPLMRGPGRNRPRRFSEPLPWTRGPFSG